MSDNPQERDDDTPVVEHDLGTLTATVARPSPEADTEQTDQPDESRDVPDELQDGPAAAEPGSPEPPDADETGRPAGSRRAARIEHLEREGEVAADFLETLLDIADLDGDLDVDVEGDRAVVAIVDSDEGRVPRRLVGTDAKVLEALQELTRLAVQAETGERSRLMLDIAGHRAARRAALVELAREAISVVRQTGSQRELEPMSAFERKVVHDEVAAAGLVSESEGVEPNRYVVILPG
ncbi:MAG: RNA-binding protein [Intrasporangium sp.]|uniref:Jag family protein n=1 Tax=Intrasporangium sp. TaxID=1925024 RepID=UPI0026478E2E|nr:R3H domain-containing nucleic acid-binding protein [Intrasporangium sp.]MDN5797221.1 RNA-binding protein [Intrasporangium sp.]